MDAIAREIKGCEVCGNADLSPVLDLGLHPMCDDLVAIGDSRVCREYPIEILFCNTCNTAHQRYQVPKQTLFPTEYHYRSRFTADVLKGMEELVASCEQRFGSLAGKHVLDVGCNDGSLLDYFRARGAVTTGIEPTDAYADAAAKGHVVYSAYFSEALAHTVVDARGRPDVITFTNVFAHIEDLPEVIRSLQILAGPHTHIVIENHYLGAVLAGNQFDTFYHEHPRTYSLGSFDFIAGALGMALLDVEFPKRYGGNIRVFLGKEATGTVAPTPGALDAHKAKESQFSKQFQMLAANIVRWRDRKGRVIREHVARHGKLRAKAFPGRAAILVKLLELDETSISTTHEKPGSMKIGHYLPGTRIPITSDDELFALEDRTQPILNLAWHIPAEISAYLVEHGYRGQQIQIVSAEDFAPN
jgi:SAM-dependent methyltransferase